MMAQQCVDAGAVAQGAAESSAARLRWYRRGFALAVVLTLVLLLLPGDAVLAVKLWVASWLPYAQEVDQADWSAHADKLQHAGLFAVLGALGCRAWQRRAERLRAFAGALLLGAGTEVLQSLVPGRACSVWDFGADALGLVLGWWLVRAALYRRAARSLSGLGVESENAPQRGQFLPNSPPHSGAMGQEAGKKWAAAAHSQPTIPKSDRLLGAGDD